VIFNVTSATGNLFQSLIGTPVSAACGAGSLQNNHMIIGTLVPPSTLFAVPNVTTHPSKDSVPNLFY